MTWSVRASLLRRTFAQLLLTAAFAALPILSVHAQPLFEEAPVPGGTAAFARVLGLSPPPDRARFVTELTRMLYASPEGTNDQADALRQNVIRHLDAFDQFESALAAAQTGERTISLSAANTRSAAALKKFLRLIGLTLREGKGGTVAPTGAKDAAVRRQMLADLGVDLDRLEARLNRGEAVRIDVPVETEPIPLPVSVWNQVFQQPVSVDRLFSAVIRNRQASLLCHGALALDDETLRFLVERPALVAELFSHDAGSFAAFAGSMRIRGNRVAVPGGENAAALWDAVVGENPGNPDRFVRELFRRQGGRLAYLYDSLAYLDAPRVSFALGLWIKDAGVRAERFKSLVATLDGFPGPGPERPFDRPPEDPAIMLTRIAVGADGVPVGPARRIFWSEAFDGIDLPGDPVHSLRNMAEDGLIDAAWLAEAVVAADVRFRSERLAQFAFGQRVFARVDESALPDTLVALRAFPRYRMLMLTLERMGITQPLVYASAARHAQRLSALDPAQAYTALGQFQGVLAILARLVRSHVLDSANAEALVASLSAVTLDDQGRYSGSIVRWVRQALKPVIGAATDDEIDDALIAALAGVRRAAGTATARVSWEDRTYRIDIASQEARRLTKVLQELQAESIGHALAVEAVAETLNAERLTLPDVQTATGDLTQLVSAFKRIEKAKAQRTIQLPGVHPPQVSYQTAVTAVQDLSRVSKPRDLKHARHVAGPLLELADDVMAEAMFSFAYAMNIGDAEEATRLAGTVGRRHDFGFGEKVEGFRLRAPWSEPVQIIDRGVPWHVTGSLLGLDLALSNLGLRRMATDGVPEAPVLRSAERDTFSKTVALLNPLDLQDHERDELVAAIERGRTRVAGLRTDGEHLEEMADEISMDGWRRRAVRWALANDRAHVPSFFSMTDLLYLGKAPAGATLDRWGMAASAYDGCICTRFPAPGRWTVLAGRQNAGVLATQVADLNLRVAMALDELRLPAALARDVLATAVQDYIDQVRPRYASDWLTLVRSAQQVPIARIEDYVAGLTANGPLVTEGVNSAPEREP